MDMILVGLAMGIVFGFVLEKSRVFEPGVIVGQFQLKNFLMLKVFLSAVMTGLAVVLLLTGVDLAGLSPKAAVVWSVTAGGLLLGAGIALTGACPGTLLAQIGAGYRDAWFGLAGGIAGAMAYAYTLEDVKALLGGWSLGKVTWMDLAGVPMWLLAVPVAAVLAAGLYWLEKRRSWREDVGKAGDGL